jgi:hypothetical protein
MNSETNFLVNTAKTLVARLERLSADSFWAHRASGIRGSLLRCLDAVEAAENADPPRVAESASALQVRVEQAYLILENAAREIKVPDDQ